VHDCCIRVTALLEYFEWTVGPRMWFFCVSFLSMLVVWVMLISYLGSIIKGHVPRTQSLRRGHRASIYSFNQDRTIHDLITIRVY